MKKYIHLLSAAVVLMTGQVWAESAEQSQHAAHTHEELQERVQHYASEKPENTEKANELMQQAKQKIAALLEQEQLTNIQLEAIHEQSYALESAVDAMREYKSYSEPLIDDVDEAVQALHYSSENHDPVITREWFLKLQHRYAHMVESSHSQPQ